MKRLFSIVCIVFLITRINSVAGQSVENITQIRFGSSGDPLNGLTVTWASIGTADKIAWGYTTNFEQGEFQGLKRDQNTRILFDYTFPDLLADSAIHYALFDSKDSIWTEEKTFKTASDTSDNQFSFTVFGDSRSYPYRWQIISEATLETDFTLFLGDIVSKGYSQADWDNWFKYGEKFISREPIYHAFGNHDKDSSLSKYDTYLSMFTLPGNELYYSFNYGNALFICLNSQEPGNATQYNWLKSTLEANKDQTWKFVFFHKPFFTSPKHEGEMDPYLNTIWKAFDDYGVDMIFNAHTHNYQRTKPINRNINTTSPIATYGNREGQGRCQIVTGGAGAPSYGLADSGLWWLERTEDKLHFCNINIDGDMLTLRVMDTNQVVFDEFILDKSITGTIDLKNNESIVFPNPSNGDFYIKAPPGGIFSYRIFNSVGKVISELKNSKASGEHVLIELTNQPAGIYFIELSTEKEKFIEKIILY
jgi:predicted MPP superfamily phosphohydrolase